MISNYIFRTSIDFSVDIAKNNVKLQSAIENKNILIIGGAGTIGSNYVKEVLHFKPKKIVIVDNNENALTELTRDLRSSTLLDYNPEYITYPVNLLSNLFDKIFHSYHFDIVANFSAHKHVRSEKDIISIEALIKNNVFGIIKLIRLCLKKQPNYFFSVSTDKATNPVNIMGASKSLMEKIIISVKDKIRVSTARFANVAFSNGSLLHGFEYRLLKKQPLSCPSNIKRFFVTPKQSGEICLLATFLGDSGDIFFPKLDFQKDQFFFKDIADKFLKNNGYVPKKMKTEHEAKNFDFKKNKIYYPIYLFKSFTSGEKTFEEFYDKSDNTFIDCYRSLGYIKTEDIKISLSKVEKDFNCLFVNPDLNKIDIIKTIKKYVPDFSHYETGKNLDDSM